MTKGCWVCSSSPLVHGMSTMLLACGKPTLQVARRCWWRAASPRCCGGRQATCRAPVLLVACSALLVACREPALLVACRMPALLAACGEPALLLVACREPALLVR